MPPDVLGGFRPLHLLGEGAMGRVYLAEEASSGRRVALKLLHRSVIERAGATEAFLRRAQQSSQLRSPYLALTEASGKLPDGTPYVVLEPLEGERLGDLLSREGALPHDRVIRLGRQICSALAEIHRFDLLHLDLKPSNVFLVNYGDTERVKLLDFSVVGAQGAPLDSPEGTPEYWSPEQARGADTGPRSDVYSLGVLFYEALAGRPPFRTHSHSDVLLAHVHATPPPLVAPPGLPPVPPRLAALVHRCLEKEPARRPAGALELRAALGALDPARSGLSSLGESSQPFARLELRARADGRAMTAPLEPGSGDPVGPVREMPGADAILGAYRLVQILGEGGMGRVYLAEHVRLGRKVALKMLRPELTGNAAAVRRFFGEARAVNRISHENIVEITDFIENEGADKYYLMELLRGETLRERLSLSGALSVERCLDIGRQMCGALSVVHQAGIVHRDLKPENVFLTERGGRSDFVKLLDFGVAKLGEDLGEGAGTKAGAILGTPEYMAPEQIGGTADRRADVYAFGVILFELVTGMKPFTASSFGELVVKHRTEAPQPPSQVEGVPHRIPLALEKLILHCLEKEPDRRPDSMAEVGAELASLQQAIESGQAALAPRPGVRGRKRLLAAAAVGGLALSGLAWAVLRPVPPAPEPVVVAPAPLPELPLIATTVQVAFDSTPEGAQVFAEGSEEPLGTTPFSAPVPRRPWGRFTFRLAGHGDGEAEVRLDRDSAVAVVLVEKQEPRPVAARRPAPVPVPVSVPAAVAAEPPTEHDRQLDRGAVINPFDE